MSKNVIFVFTGTGNSLKLARETAEELTDCDIVSMGNSAQYDLVGGYETIGFFFRPIIGASRGRSESF
jgi:hypothetical protein